MLTHILFTWISANPEQFASIVTFVGSVIIAIVKAQMTPEKYALWAPRIAGVFKILTGMLPDLVKTAKGFKQVATGKSDAEFRAVITEEEETK